MCYNANKNNSQQAPQMDPFPPLSPEQRAAMAPDDVVGYEALTLAAGMPAPAVPPAPPPKRRPGRPPGSRNKVARVPQGVDLASPVGVAMRRACEMRQSGITLADIGAALNLSPNRISQLLAQAKRTGAITAAEMAKGGELDHLLALRAKLQTVIDAPGVVQRNGVPVMLPAINPATGAPMVDTTGQPVMVPMVDHDRQLAAINVAISLSARIGRLMGHDAPKRSEQTIKDTRPAVDPLAGLSSEQRMQLMREVIQQNAPKSLPARDMGEVVEVVPREVKHGNQT